MVTRKMQSEGLKEAVKHKEKGADEGLGLELMLNELHIPSGHTFLLVDADVHHSPVSELTLDVGELRLLVQVELLHLKLDFPGF